METREEFIEHFQENVVRVVFEKSNGEHCVKYATLREDILPPPPEPTDENDSLKKKRKVNPQQVSFWSLADHAWRSFKIDRLKGTDTLTESEVQDLLEIHKKLEKQDA